MSDDNSNKTNDDVLVSEGPKKEENKDQSVNPKSEQAMKDNAEKNTASEIEWTGAHYSGKALRGDFILLLLITIAYIGFFAYFFKPLNDKLIPCALWTLMLGVPLIFWIRFWCIYLYRTITISYVLERDKLIEKRGLFSKKTDITMIARIIDIQMKQTLWEQWFLGNTGTIVLMTSDKTSPEQILSGLENPELVLKTFSNLTAKFVERRGIQTLGSAGLDNTDLN